MQTIFGGGVLAVAVAGLQIACGLSACASPGSATTESSEKSTTGPAPTASTGAEACADGPACFELGVSLKGDVEQQRIAYARACELNHADGCYMGGYNANGAKDLAAAVKLFGKGCDLGSAGACDEMGILYQDGQGVAADPAKAFEMFAKACESDRENRNGLACHSAGIRAVTGKGIASDPIRGRALLEMACERAPALCFDFGLALEQGVGGAPDLSHARSVWERGCAAGSAEACNNLGMLRRDGKGGAVDRRGARRAFDQACKAGADVACVNLKQLE